MAYPIPSRVPLPTLRPYPDYPQPMLANVSAQAPMGVLSDAAPQVAAQQQATQQPMGFMDKLGQSSDALLAFGSGLLSGRTPNEQWGGGMAALGQGIKDIRSKNLTSEWVKKNAPEYSDLVDAGTITPADVFKLKIAENGKSSLIEAGGSLYNTKTGQWVTPPAQSQKPTSDMNEYELAKRQGFNGSFLDYQLQLKKAGATNINMNNEQANAATYADRMKQADAVLEDPKIIQAMSSTGESMKAGIPVIGNFIISQDRQTADQAKRNFINAVLRKESGAVISPSEFDNAEKQYFPQPGDSEAVIQQKAENRKLAIQGISRAAGPNYTTSPGMAPAGQQDPLGIRK